jgi:hypothetical protein
MAHTGSLFVPNSANHLFSSYKDTAELFSSGERPGIDDFYQGKDPLWSPTEGVSAKPN